MPRVALLESSPDGYGLLNSNPPESILTKSAPCLEIIVSRSEDFVGRQDVKIMTWSQAHDWTDIGRLEVTASSIDPFYRRVPLADDVLYACAVDAGSSEDMDGSITVVLNDSFQRPTDSGLLAVIESTEQTDPYPTYLTVAEADARYAPIGGGGEGSAPVTDLLLNGSAGVSAGGGAFTFAMGLTPTSIAAVIYDGAPLYRGQTPGFSWSSGSSNLTIRPPYGTMPAAAKILVLKQ